MKNVRRRAVVTLGIDGEAPQGHPGRQFQCHRRGVERIRAALQQFVFSGHFFSWCDGYPPDCPKHEEIEYAFKPLCLLEAVGQGYTSLLWLDSSIVIHQPIDAIFESIEENGHLFTHAWHSVGEYCSDAALATLELTREEAFRIPSCATGILGLDVTSANSMSFLNMWRNYALDGVTFKGAKWSGVRGFPRTVSSDPRVKGHRHDQTAASVVAWRMGMMNWRSRWQLRSFLTVDRNYVRVLDEHSS